MKKFTLVLSVIMIIGNLVILVRHYSEPEARSVSLLGMAGAFMIIYQVKAAEHKNRK